MDGYRQYPQAPSYDSIPSYHQHSEAARASPSFLSPQLQHQPQSPQPPSSSDLLAPSRSTGGAPQGGGSGDLFEMFLDEQSSDSSVATVARNDGLPSYAEALPPRPSSAGPPRSSGNLLESPTFGERPASASSHPVPQPQQPEQLGYPMQQPKQQQQLPQQLPQQQQQQQFQPQQPQAAHYPMQAVQQQQSYPSMPVQSAPPVRQPQQQHEGDIVQNLLERYPNPQTENEKLRKAFEVLASQFQSHMRRMEDFVNTVDKRLNILEDSIKEVQDRQRSRDFVDRERPPHNNRLKKKKKKRSMSMPDKQVQNDEELAKKLQQQFNAEAYGVPIRDEKVVQSDEEYAKRLQAMYLQRDLKKETGGGAKKKDSEKEKKEAAQQQQQQQKSLWSRLFGASSDDESEEELANKSKDKKESSAKKDAAKPASPSAPAAAPTGQPIQYIGYPGQPLPMYPGTMPHYQYVPMPSPGAPQYYYQPPSQ